MDKLKIAEWGEKLKTGGAQMSRMVSEKVKDKTKKRNRIKRIIKFTIDSFLFLCNVKSLPITEC